MTLERETVEQTKGAVMHVFENDVTEWFVAESVEDAVAAAKEMNAKHGHPVPDSELDLDFRQVPDHIVLTMADASPLGRETSKTAAEWAATSPRGFLMTTEY